MYFKIFVFKFCFLRMTIIEVYFVNKDSIWRIKHGEINYTLILDINIKYQ